MLKIREFTTWGVAIGIYIHKRKVYEYLVKQMHYLILYINYSVF